ncbi:hypothetical protein D3C80_1742690 [compost metagenome]
MSQFGGDRAGRPSWRLSSTDVVANKADSLAQTRRRAKASEFAKQGFQPQHVLGRGGFEAEGFAGDRVDEAEDGGVQGLAFQAGRLDGGADGGGGAA